ncbi:MAG: GDSL-type esterase/lipase family protein [Clostridium sp.]|uniref:GDSL-type esterase/lipase family protein n=1 Tax=Clostridium sp. TaxID=1506 RepID=UPI002908EC78|nr:GDSL-type esterase/lipase family protein [Clostridium sp.]MDU5108685.1 GDSL-type esterase/lipase family protein [Clostridium sp.]MDU5111995.1 GDSL-type esterase/lipase family protein [Clostridium sp.]
MKRLILILISIILVFISVRGVFFSSIIIKDNKTINEAIEVLNNNNDIETIKNSIKLEKEKSKEKEEIQASEEISFFQFYKNTLFLGDSITEGLIDYELVNEYNVIAEKGDNVKDAISKIDKIKQINPESIVLFYGMNDVIEFDGLNENLTEDKFREIYKSLINTIRSELPKVKIYAISPTNVLSNAINTNYRLTNENIFEFRNIIKEVCSETNVAYVDVNSKISSRTDLYEGDGIHFKYEFYNIWLETLKESILIGE